MKIKVLFINYIYINIEKWFEDFHKYINFLKSILKILIYYLRV